MAAARADRLEDEARELLAQADGSTCSSQGSTRSSPRGRRDRSGRTALFRLAMLGGMVLVAPPALDLLGPALGEFVAEVVAARTPPR